MTRALMLEAPPTAEEIRDLLTDPDDSPLRKDVVDRMTERQLQRNAELHGRKFEDWLVKQRTGK